MFDAVFCNNVYRAENNGYRNACDLLDTLKSCRIISGGS